MRKVDAAREEVNSALDSVADQAEALKLKEGTPEFIFAVMGGEVQSRTQNASVTFSKELALNLLASMGLEDALHVVEIYEKMVDEAEAGEIAPLSATVH